MPMAPMKHCPAGHPPYSTARCPGCTRARQRAQDAARPSAARRGYDRDWQELRKRFLGAHPRCSACGATATEVDHIVAIADGGARLAWSNLRSFCKPHHSQRTMADLRAKRGGRLA